MENASRKFKASLLKLLQENVISGDFKLRGFQSKLKIFILFCVRHIKALSEDIPVDFDGGLAVWIKKLSADQFSVMKVPKTKRLHLTGVYLSTVLNRRFVEEVELEEAIKERAGEKVVFGEDTLRKSLELVNGLLKRQRDDTVMDERNPKKPRVVIIC